MNIQSKKELDAFYRKKDPWNYYTNDSDRYRLQIIINYLKSFDPRYTLDIGCGNGFITNHLPGKKVFGIDYSKNAINWAKKNTKLNSICYKQMSIFELNNHFTEKFDLVLITGVLYPQYIGKSITLISEILDKLISPKGIIMTCHIREMNPPNLPFNLIDQKIYEYKKFTHVLEVYRK